MKNLSLRHALLVLVVPCASTWTCRGVGWGGEEAEVSWAPSEWESASKETVTFWPVSFSPGEWERTLVTCVGVEGLSQLHSAGLAFGGMAFPESLLGVWRRQQEVSGAAVY